MKNKELAIVVLSCDKFSTLWPLFFDRFNKFFPDIGAKVYLLSNFKNLEFKTDTQINLIKTGEDISWSYNLEKLLISLEEEKVMFLMDDGLLSNHVNKAKFENIYKEFLNKDMDYLNLKSSLFADKNLDSLFRELPPGTSYRAAIAPALWKKHVLLDILNNKENAWQFEIFGSQRSNIYNRFYSLNESLFKFDHLVIKGKIDRSIYKQLKLNGEHSEFDLPVMTYLDYLTDKLRYYRSMFVKKFIPIFMVSSYRALKYKK